MAQGERIEIDGERHCTCTPRCCFCSGQHRESSPPRHDMLWHCGVCGERLTGLLTDPCSNCTVFPDLRGLDLDAAAFKDGTFGGDTDGHPSVYDIPPGVTPPPPDSVLRVPSEMVKDGHRVRAGVGRGPFVEVVGTSRFTARTGEVLDVWIDLADGTRLRHGARTPVEMVNPAMADAAGRYPLVLPTPDPWDDDQEETA